MEELSRTELLLGEKAVKRLMESRVAIFGIGGVGGYVAEALARCGIGAFDLIDNDTVSASNINRQVIALHSTIGMSKVNVMKERILDILPSASVNTRECFYLPENAAEFDFSEYSYVVDAVDTVTAKLSIITQAKRAGVPVISSMGAGNRLNPSMLMVDDIYNTSVCPLARVMRRELRKLGVESLKVVYSREEPVKADAARSVSAACDSGVDGECGRPVRRSIPGSIAFVPSAAGLLIASEVVKDLCIQ